MKKLLSLLFIGLSLFSYAQDVEIESVIDEEITICDDAASHQVTIRNNSLTTLTDVVIGISLPEGIVYEEGSFTESTSKGMTVTRVTADSGLVFSSGDIAAGDSVLFSIEYTAEQATIALQNNGTVFRNNVSISSNEENENLNSASYNILYPVLSITSVTPESETIISGTSTTRVVRIINGGYGRVSDFYLTDVQNKEGLTLDSTDIGTINGDSIYISAAEIMAVGNNDAYLDKNEYIDITQYLTGVTCSDKTVTATLSTFWGCSGDLLQGSSSSYSNILIDFQTPTLALSTTSDFDGCFATGQGYEQTLTIRNTGSGVASNIIIDLYKSKGTKYDYNMLTRIDVSTLTYKIGANGTEIAPSNPNLTNSAPSVCLGGAPTGRLDFNAGSLEPGDTMFVSWEMVACEITQCNNTKVKGWKVEVDYEDVCATKTYSVSKVGQNDNNQKMNMFTESPADLYNQQYETYSFVITSFSNNLPADDGAHYEAVISLDDDLLYDSLEFQSNGVVWTPYSLVYDALAKTVTAKYPLPAPFTINKSEFNLRLQGDCGTSGWKDIAISVSYIPDTTCSSVHGVPLVCDKTSSTYLHCPGVGCEGLAFKSFNAERVSLGLPDNDQDGLADVAGSLDMDKIKTSRAMVGDTIKSTAIGKISSTSGTWEYAKFESESNYGSVMEYVTGDLQLYDASSSTWYDLEGLTATTSTNSKKRTFEVDISQSVLGGINGALSSFEYDDGDSLVLNVYYVVVSNVQGDLKENTFDNEFYVSDYASPSNGQKKQCDEKHGRITLVGYAYRNRSQNYITLNNCSKKLNQQYGMEVANMYAGGNFFPYEFRDWGYLTEVRVIIPDGYEIESASLKHYSTINTNSKRTETQAITYDSSFGNTYIYNVGTYFENETLTISDDGFNGYFYVTLSPMCNTTIDRWHEVYYEFNYQQPAIMGGDTSGLITAVSDRIMYDPAELVISSPNPIQSTTSKEVSWNLTIENENNDADAPYMWLYIDEPNNFDLDSVVEVETSQALTPDNGFYKYGTLDQGESTDYIIYGSYSACDTATFQVYTGFSCDGFPASFESYDCAKEQYTLGVDPKEAQYQVRISNEELGDPCVPEVTLSLDISSVDIAHMYDMTITVTTPDTSHVKLLDGTTEFSSGGGATASVADPTYTTNTYTYTIGDYNASYPVDGIPGILSIPDNTYNIQFDLEAGLNYEPGDFVYIYIEGSDACGDTVPTTVLAYDLNTNFRKDNTAGLNIDIGNSWSASWGDYDNDGYDDLFVPINTIGESNILYHNDGDGTFTKITTGPVVEEDGSSVAGTWGDYDNDGYIDLFVANNINSENKLYHNEGDGTFTSIENSPIVDKGTYSHAAAWADYNRDGNLDLIVSDFHPTNFNFLFYGDGSGGFTEDKISDVGLDATSAVGVSWGDYDNDGDLDLFIANTNDENNNLYENQAGVLKRITTGDIVNDGGSSVGGTWGDYDNDGDLDLYVTNSRSYESNFFYENDGDGTFTKITTGTIVESISNSNGASWVDYNNDGYLDLMVANDQSEQNFLFRNNGDKSFSSVDNVITQDESDAYGVAWSDYDNDGDYDLIVANRGANVNDLFVNGKGSCTNHIVFTLDGCNSNSKGIGALIKVKANINGVDLWQSKHVATQNSAMGGQNSSNILFGLGDASTVDSAVVYWPSGIITYLSSTTVNAINTVTEQCGSKVCGTVYHDVNSNGVQDPGEKGIPNQTILITPGEYQAFTASDGSYQLYLDDGTYDLSLVDASAWNQLLPISNGDISLVIDNATQSEYCGNEFTAEAVCGDPDLSINMGTTAFRRGLLNDLNINVQNQGAYVADTTIELEITMSDEMYIIEDNYTSVSTANNERTYVFTLSDIDGLSDTTISFTDSIDVNATLGDTLSIESNVTYAGTECAVLNNEASVTDIIVGSIDPNDKQVFVSKYKNKQEEILQNKVSPSKDDAEDQDLLTYKIRFQNMGTYAARRVQIIDTLSEKLDWSTFKMESSSHEFNVSIRNGIVMWINERIELPFMDEDEEGSQGYVTFSILPKADLPRYSLVKNVAHIQFDRNEYIQTNSANAVVGIGDYAADKTTTILYPNPTRDVFTVLIVDDEQRPVTIKTIEVVDHSGNVVKRIEPSMLKVPVDISSLSHGMYFVRLTTSNGMQYRKKILKY